ncbi:hypothetical protein [uncultured Aquimarina sp.]|uniref:hypothetical protein n=1 Tax=uncultured Aquimarina sp. TaxID=575652 RepID=UPI00262ECBCF|nr:hypothetical protein [uncultured Aquimarina sp.]
MDQKTKEAIENSLNKKRKDDLSIILEDLKRFPDFMSDEDIATYQNKLGYKIYNSRLEYIRTFSEETPLKGLKEIPKDDMNLFINIWAMQTKINLEYEDKYNSEVKNLWNNKVQ